ncbi:MAG: sigma-70 family RNA polymerase sigma factor [Ignavibacteriales bacterium]|nr:sigma-70 family RNA polymerase sigma factor [Ignavibacteriales bacterium]
MSARTDLELLQDFQSGHEQAFNEIVLRYQERIYWLAKRFVNDRDDADEITQEVFVKAYESLKGFRGESNLFTWLYRIAVNISLNHLRKQRVRDFFRIDDSFDHLAVDDDSPDAGLERDENQKLIEEAVKLLPEKQKAVFLLRYHDELSYEEIAKLLGTSVGGLKANYFHAVKKIGEHIRRAHGTS